MISRLQSLITWTNSPKRREQNRIYLFAAVNLKPKCRRLLKLIADRYEASRGLSAIAELMFFSCQVNHVRSG